MSCACGEQAAFEGDREGVECGLPAVHPPPSTTPGRVEAACDQVEATTPDRLPAGPVELSASDAKALRNGVPSSRIGEASGATDHGWVGRWRGAVSICRCGASSRAFPAKRCSRRGPLVAVFSALPSNRAGGLPHTARRRSSPGSTRCCPPGPVRPGGGDQSVEVEATERCRTEEQLAQANTDLSNHVGHLRRLNHQISQLAEMPNLLQSVANTDEAFDAIGYSPPRMDTSRWSGQLVARPHDDRLGVLAVDIAERLDHGPTTSSHTRAERDSMGSRRAAD